MQDFVDFVLVLIFQEFFESRAEPVRFVQVYVFLYSQPVLSSDKKALRVVSNFVNVMWILVECNAIRTDHKVHQLKLENLLVVDREANLVRVIHDEKDLKVRIKLSNYNLVFLELNRLQILHECYHHVPEILIGPSVSRVLLLPHFWDWKFKSFDEWFVQERVHYLILNLLW